MPGGLSAGNEINERKTEYILYSVSASLQSARAYGELPGPLHSTVLVPSFSSFSSNGRETMFQGDVLFQAAGRQTDFQGEVLLRGTGRQIVRVKPFFKEQADSQGEALFQGTGRETTFQGEALFQGTGRQIHNDK